MKHLFSLLFTLAGLCLLTTCGGSAGGTGGGGQLTATHFSVNTVPAATAGTAFQVTVTARDASNNVVATYSGTIHFTSSDGAASLPPNQMLLNGVGNFSATLNSPGSQTITATDTVNAALTGNSNSIKVSAAAGAAQFSVTAPANAATGAQFNVTVTALDAGNNIVTTYSGTVHLTSTDKKAVLPHDSTLTNGVLPFPVTLESVGSWTIAATDAANASITGTSNSIDTAVPIPPTISTSPAPPPGKVNNRYSFTFTATGGVGQLLWSETGPLPPTMSLLSNGSLFGIPKSPGTFPIEVMLQDSLGQNAVPQGFTIEISPSRFNPVGSMHMARFLHTPTLLGGGLVLIAGGTQGFPSATSSAETFDPSSESFTAVGSMTTSRSSHTATLLNNGTVLITGGNSGFGGVLLSAELFNPATGSFTATGNMTTWRRDHTATVLQNGQVLIVGGFDGAVILPTAELFNPSTGTFTATGSMATARSHHTATLLTNGNVLVTGGFGSATAELYDPGTGSFTTTGSMTAVRSDHTATLLKNGQVLVLGGNTADLYDPSSGIFTPTGNPTIPRRSHTATLLNDGTVLVTGGISGSVSGGEVYCEEPRPLATASAELFNPVTGTFAAIDFMATQRSSHTATLLDDGDVVVAGGIWWSYTKLDDKCFKQQTFVTASAEQFH